MLSLTQKLLNIIGVNSLSQQQLLTCTEVIQRGNYNSSEVHIIYTLFCNIKIHLPKYTKKLENKLLRKYWHCKKDKLKFDKSFVVFREILTMIYRLNFTNSN